MPAGAITAPCTALRVPKQQRATPLRSAPSRPLAAQRLRLAQRVPRRCAAVRPCASAAAAAGNFSGAPVPAPQLVAGVAGLWQRMVDSFGAAVKQAALDIRRAERQQAITTHLRKSFKAGRMLMSVAPFAAATSSTAGSANTLILVMRAVGSFIKLYLLLLFVRVLLSWFPMFEWDSQPWLALRQVTDPYLNLFRGLVPPLLGTIDFTPLFGFLILQFLAGALEIGDDDYW